MAANIRKAITEEILRAKVQQGLKWSDIAAAIGRSKEWTATACLGDACFDKDEAEKLGKLLNLDEDSIRWLQVVPNRNIHAEEQLARDPVMMRLKEAIGVYGPAMRELIIEEFGDGIISAINFDFKVEREAHEEGDRHLYIRYKKGSTSCIGWSSLITHSYPITDPTGEKTAREALQAGMTPYRLSA